MSSADRYERRLPTLLEELSAPRTPDYFDDILGQVGRTRQRPGWTFPERWIPMSAVSGRLAAAPRAPVRAIVFVALLILAVVAAIAIIAGSQQHRVPAPFGPADNGVIAFVDADGAIRSGLADAAEFGIIVPGPGNERPVFSADGTRLAFLHKDSIGNYDIVVSAPDGQGARTVNAEAIQTVSYLGWTPDGGAVVVGALPHNLLAFDAAKQGEPTLITDKVRFSGTVSGLNGWEDRVSSLFRAPRGDELAILGSGPEGDGLYAIRRDGSGMRPLLTPKTGGLTFVDLMSPQWSPDGSQIAVTVRQPSTPEYATHVYLMNADGSDLRRINQGCQGGGETSENFAAWSPDSTRIALMRWCPDKDDPVNNPNPRPITVIDVATGAEREIGIVEANGQVGWGWSPDGKSIIEVPGPPVDDGNRLLIVDATTGAITRTSGVAEFPTSWQRTIPKP
jgi:hypothetical protein